MKLNLLLSHLIAVAFVATVALSKDSLMFMYSYDPALTVAGLIGWLFVCTVACFFLSVGTLQTARRLARRQAEGGAS